MGLTARIEEAGAPCSAACSFYQSYAREMAEANGWRRLATNSAKLVNIVGGYGYRPALMSIRPASTPLQRRQDRAMSGEIFFCGGRAWGKRRAGSAVAKDGFSARYDLDRLRGVFRVPTTRARRRELYRRRARARCRQGGVATAWMLHEMKRAASCRRRLS